MLKKIKSHVAKFGVLTIAVALVVGTVGCGLPTSGFTAKYTLTISSTTGGTVITPGEGLFQYAQGTVVDLVAEPDVGYQFVSWTSNANTIANVRAATTTITVNNNYYFVIANFTQ